MRSSPGVRLTALLGCLSAIGGPRRPLAAQAPIPIRELRPTGRTSERLGIVLGVRSLSNGSVLINDAGQRRILLFDSTFSRGTVVVDSVPGSRTYYGPRPTPIIPWRGDSTLLVDVASQSLLVLDPAGKFARAIAAPKPQEIAFLSQSASGVDAHGRLVYRGVTRGEPRDTSGASPDSSPIVRADFQTRALDTVARVKMPINWPLRVVEEGGRRVGKVKAHPLQIVDEWVMAPDGAIAIVRGSDYRIEWFTPDGRTTSTKLPFDWRRLTDDDKQRLVDSSRAADSARGAAPRPGRVGLSIGGQALVTQVEYVPLSEIPDYYPPIGAGSVRADPEGNIWILPTTTTHSRGGELVYDVVNRQSTLFMRVRLPAGRSIAGFGPNGTVFLLAGDKDSGYWVERAIFEASRR